MKDYSEHFRKLIAPLVPRDASIVIPRGWSELVMLVSWKLQSEPLRASRRSRTVRIVIASDALSSYAKAPSVAQTALDERLTRWLRAQISKFDPNHDAPLGVEPPPVTWRVGPEELHG